MNSKGIQVDAVYGFTSMLLSVLEKFKPKYIACAFDTKKPTFRHVDYPDYKAQRKPTDQSLIAQFPLVEEVLKAFRRPSLRIFLHYTSVAKHFIKIPPFFKIGLST